MKKKFITCVVALFLCLAFCGTHFIRASAMPLDYDEYDQVFLQTIDCTVKENYDGLVEISANKEYLYDVDLNTIGFIYDFSVQGETGYATVINRNGYAELTEIYFNSTLPYSADTQKRVYVTKSVLAYYEDGNYYLAEDNSVVEKDKLEKVAYYSADTVFTTYTETIYYTTKVNADSYNMAVRFPSLSSISGKTNACVPVAGANILQYWDRFFPDLISDYNPGVAKGQYYLYNAPSEKLDAIGADLYDRMDMSSAGTTIDGFKDGMNSYCIEKGFSVTYERCMTDDGVFDYDLAKTRIRSGSPLVLFLDPFSIGIINESDGSDTIITDRANAAHAVAAFGFRDILYTLSNATTRREDFFRVASGIATQSTGYLSVSHDTVFDYGCGVHVQQ